MADYDNLVRLASIIRDETANKQNTALRVGGALLELVYALRDNSTALATLEQLAAATDTRSRYVRGATSDPDALKAMADLGLYVVTGGGWRGILGVQFDAQNTVSQVALSSSMPSYEGGSLTWLSGRPCFMTRKYVSGAWTQWELGSAELTVTSTSTGVLEFSDPAGHVLVRFEGGHIKTKFFDSSDIKLPEAVTGVSVTQTAASSVSIVSTKSGGGSSSASIAAATTSKAGVMSAADKAKLDGLTGGTSLSGKKVGALGDSITEGYNTTRTYLQYLADLSDCTTYNYGLGGSRIVEVSGDSVQSFVERASTVRTDLDILFVFGGINDFYWSECLLGEQYTVNSSTGAFTLNTDVTTFYGAYNTIMQTLITRLPKARIYLVTPIHAGRFSTGSKSTWMRNAKGLTLMDFIAAVKNVGELWGVPVIDLASESGMNPNVTASQQAYYNHKVPGTSNPDYLHPDANGHKRIAETLLKHII